MTEKHRDEQPTLHEGEEPEEGLRRIRAGGPTYEVIRELATEHEFFESLRRQYSALTASRSPVSSRRESSVEPMWLSGMGLAFTGYALRRIFGHIRGSRLTLAHHHMAGSYRLQAILVLRFTELYFCHV